jgi:hypothetical protein
VRSTDSDEDTLPDDWELFYFSSLTNAAPDDVDHDGADNGSEFQAGTDPASAASIFKVAVAASTNEIKILHWPNLPNRQFEVQFSENLTTWQTLTNPPVFFPTPQLTTWMETTNAPARLYRVQAIAR